MPWQHGDRERQIHVFSGCPVERQPNRGIHRNEVGLVQDWRLTLIRYHFDDDSSHVRVDQRVVGHKPQEIRSHETCEGHVRDDRGSAARSLIGVTVPFSGKPTRRNVNSSPSESLPDKARTIDASCVTETR